jgi:hypothetical protein
MCVRHFAIDEPPQCGRKVHNAAYRNGNGSEDNEACNRHQILWTEICLRSSNRVTVEGDHDGGGVGDSEQVSAGKPAGVLQCQSARLDHGNKVTEAPEQVSR